MAESSPDSAGTTGGLQILLVEDNDEVAAGTQALLRMMGHEVTCVFNADAAMPLISDAAPTLFDVVISDIHMPGTKNGIDLAEAAMALSAPLPMILITGYAQELERARNVNVRVLSKPFDIALLERMLQAIRREREAREQTAGRPG
jgi:CheY-like chemotaxis protein